jgi:hypothetical protein
MVNTVNKLPAECKTRLELKIDLCGAEGWDVWEDTKGLD